MSPGPDGAGELVTPTGAALVRVLSVGLPPATYTPLATGLGAGTKDFPGRANALRIILADVAEASVAANDAANDATQGALPREELLLLACDLDDMSPEYLALVTDRAREQGALDVTLLATSMKKGRAGTRIELLCRPADGARFELLLLAETTTIGVRRSVVTRTALPRSEAVVDVLGTPVRLKVVTLPDGSTRAKPEFDDVQRVALAMGRRPADIYQLALAGERR